MAGTKAGGVKAAQTNKVRHGSDFYAKIGAKRDKKGTTGGFAANRELARVAGRKGGQTSQSRRSNHSGDQPASGSRTEGTGTG